MQIKKKLNFLGAKGEFEIPASINSLYIINWSVMLQPPPGPSSSFVILREAHSLNKCIDAELYVILTF